jgi:DNA repair protein RecO (recombination protein O)
MNWIDSGFLLSKKRYNENSVIAEIYTENHGKCSGIIFGASSKKIKNYLQLGNKLHINYTYKIEGKIGYFKVEILKALTPLYFDNKEKLMCLSSAMNLIKLLTVESQENSSIFQLIDNFFMILPKKNWIKEYIFWELKLLKLIGYDLELKNLVNREVINNKTKYFVKSKTENKIVPNFLIDLDKDELNNINLLDGLKLVGDYLEKTILKPNNINFPSERLDFVNILKRS